MSRCLGIDFGSQRMGLAISDETGVIALPLPTVAIRGARHARQAVAEICIARAVQKIVLGLPLDMQGRTGPAAEAVLHFAAQLREDTALPVETWDERLSTSMAERMLIGGNVRRARRRDLRDQVAAQIILQSYLDAHGSGPEPSPPA